MKLKQTYRWLSLLISFVICQLSLSNAKPTYYDLDSYDSSYERSYDHRTYDNSYASTYGKPLTSGYLGSLGTGYYYVDSGYIAPVSSRSLSAYSSGVDSYKYAPVVRYRKSRPKRKKLFVPNFFG